ncbi:hypothetical protein N7493_003529 [Penicillium malachiteum]|uniref:Uncharacterized protein n=1 Tax=Penicillium malachiteum TaxID=1324776 RepID=A0AAD6MXP9_9EURO|nr:hypothetical protein N7493_003529 [Penicillium malachiteum]
MSLRQITRLTSRLSVPVPNLSGTRALSSTASRLNAEKKSAYREGAYGAFARPFGKVFLGAVLTYQIIYWTWMKLETDETKLEKNGKLYFGPLAITLVLMHRLTSLEQLSALEKKARELAAAQK